MKNAWLGVVFMFVATALSAQSSGTIEGVVTDTNRSPLPGVTVELSGQSTATRATVTDSEGRYEFEHLRAGTYHLEFILLSFARPVVREVIVSEGNVTRVDRRLVLTVNAAITVTGKQTFRNLADQDEPVNDLIGIADAATVGVVTSRQLDQRPIQRSGSVLETIPGVIVSQHSGEGKANQFYLRGFNLDHGTDFATTIAGIPVNMPTHAHGQGYADTNFLIPELVSGVQYKKGPYYVEEGDFSSAGSAAINYTNTLDEGIVSVEGGAFGFARVLLAASSSLERGSLLYAVEMGRNDGPWESPDDFRKINGVLRYTRGDTANAISLTGMLYSARWNSTDQVPFRASRDNVISRFGSIDPTDGGRTERTSGSIEWQRRGVSALTRGQAYVIRYGLDLFSNFTYFLDDPVNGDQFEQADERTVAGGRLSREWLHDLGTIEFDSTVGVETRNDWIDTVGLYSTRARERISAVREDRARQSSVAIFYQARTQWLPRFRTLAGLRADSFRFDIRSDRPENSGRRQESILSPKFTAIFGPWRSSEVYLNFGQGFHSNDGRGATIRFDPMSGEPVNAVDPLVRTRGMEIGLRSTPLPRLHSTISLWRLQSDSELVFVGDAGTTAAGRPSRRTGVEWSSYFRVNQALTIDLDVASSRARFTDADPAGDHIPGAPGAIVSGGVSFGSGPVTGSLRLRNFGSRPLVEDNSVRSRTSRTMDAKLNWMIGKYRMELDGFNLTNARSSDIDYYYTSRLPGEPSEGVLDIHSHPQVPRSLRVLVGRTF